jgi:hypothetical protein
LFHVYHLSWCFSSLPSYSFFLAVFAFPLCFALLDQGEIDREGEIDRRGEKVSQNTEAYIYRAPSIHF